MHPKINLPNVQKEGAWGGGVKGVLNNVKKNCKIGREGHPLLPMDRAPPMIPSPGTKLPRPDTMPPAGAWAKMTLGRSRIVMEIQGSIQIPDC